MITETLVGEFLPVGGIRDIRSELSQAPVRWWIPDVSNLSEATDTYQRYDDTSATPRRLRSGVSRTGVQWRAAEEVAPKVKWLGFVTEILSDGFCARFQSATTNRKAIVAEFDFNELALDDQAILKVGAHVVWAIFTERRKGGLENSSVLYIRRLPSPSSTTIEAAQSELHEWFGNLAE
ncbi:MAG: hypothetical protein WCK77_19755 [Verrucomicrobiota bacterium]